MADISRLLESDGLPPPLTCAPSAHPAFTRRYKTAS